LQIETISAPRDLLWGIYRGMADDNPFLADLEALLESASEPRVGSARLPALRVVGEEGGELEPFDKGWNACIEKSTAMNEPQIISTLRGSPGEPEVFLHVHELLSNSAGIWLGCADEDIVRKSHDEGETGTDIVALVRLVDHRQYVSKLLIANMELETEVKALKLAETDNPAKPCTDLEEANKKLLHYGQWVAVQTERLTQSWGRIDLLESLVAKQEFRQEQVVTSAPGAGLGSNWWDGLKAEAYGVFWTQDGVAHSRFTQEGEGPRSLAFGRDYIKSLLGTECSDIEPVVRLSEVKRLSKAVCNCGQTDSPIHDAVEE
jgi:hypothetical protein